MAQNSPVLVAAFYRFAPLQNLQELRVELQQLGGDQGVLGTVLLAAEGVNGTVWARRKRSVHCSIACVWRLALRPCKKSAAGVINPAFCASRCG